MAQSEWRAHDMARPRPGAVTPPAQQLPAPAPADAVILFDGTDLSAWEAVEGGPAPVEAGAFVIEPGTGNIQTKQGFGDVQLHVEWSAPTEIEGDSQGRGNSGVFLMQRYEVQVLDSYENETYADGQAAALYGQFPPLANAIRPPGAWQAYDIYFRGPRFAPAGALLEPAHITVVHNGILVQNNETFWGPTNWLQADPYASHADALPIMLQDHTNPVRFRNVWVRELAPRPEPTVATAAAATEAGAVAPAVLDRLAGTYALWPGNETVVRRVGDGLRVSVLGPELELVPVSATELAFRRTDARLTFELDGSGAPVGLVMHLGGVDYPAKRVDG